MESLLIFAVLSAAPHWPLVAFMVARFMAMIDLALVGCTLAYAAVRMWDGLGFGQRDADALKMQMQSRITCTESAVE